MSEEKIFGEPYPCAQQISNDFCLFVHLFFGSVIRMYKGERRYVGSIPQEIYSFRTH